MSHPFFKKLSNVSGLPSLASKSIDRIRKFAHHKWDIVADPNGPVAIRKTEDTAKLDPVSASHMHDSDSVVDDIASNTITPGELVLLFMGGRKLEARVLMHDEDGLTLSTDDGYLYDIDPTWVQRTAQQDPPQQLNRSITREDIPAQSPEPPTEQPDMHAAKAVKVISDMVMANGGTALISLPSLPNGQPRMMEVKQGQDGLISATLYVMSPQKVDSRTFKNMQDLVQQFQIDNADTLQVLVPGQGWSKPKL